MDEGKSFLPKFWQNSNVHINEKKLWLYLTESSQKKSFYLRPKCSSVREDGQGMYYCDLCSHSNWIL